MDGKPLCGGLGGMRVLPNVITEDLDLAAAAAAGPAYWGWRPDDAGAVGLALAGGVSAAAVATSITAGELQHFGLSRSLVVSAGAWLAMATWLAVGWWIGDRVGPLSVVVGLRLLSLVVVLGLWGAAHDGQLRLWELWPIGGLLGFDTAATLHTLGLPIQPLRQTRALLLSSGHLGVLAGLIALATTGFGDMSARTALSLYLGLLVNVAVAVGAARLTRQALGAVARDEARWRAAEALDRANWIHDEMCGLLIPLRQQLRSGAVGDLEEVRTRLDDIDFELRQIQLDETATHHQLTIADVIQVWGRRVQAHGARFEAPSWDVTRAPLEEVARERLARVLGVSVPNALAAGAELVRLGVEREGHQMVVEVTDDAGGFDTNDLPPGRGLHRLARELGPDLQISATHFGTTVSCRIPVTT